MMILEKLRSAHIKRWHVVRVAREQNNAEHMYRVQLLVVEICKRLKIKPNIAYTARDWALVHDLPEVFTGDLPTNGKILLREKADLEHDIFDQIDVGLLDEVDRAIYLRAKKLELPLDIVKLADLMEAIHFLSIEKVGEHAAYVESYIKLGFTRKLEACELKWQGYPWHEVADLMATVSFAQ